MTSKEYLQDVLRIEDPDNYLVLNFASDSIKRDANIIQLTYIHKGEMSMYYVHGGDPRLNNEFTSIPAKVYENESLQAMAVEDDLVEVINDEEIEYIVYNNVSWNKRLVTENGWNKLLTKFNRLPCLALSDYETVRRAHAETLFDFGNPEKGILFKEVCALVNKRAKGAPKGSRPQIYTNYYDRGMDEESIPIFTTESEKLTFAMDKIMGNILNRTKVDEVYDV